MRLKFTFTIKNVLSKSDFPRLAWRCSGSVHASAGDPVQSVAGELRFPQATWHSQKNKPKHQAPGILILPPSLLAV